MGIVGQDYIYIKILSFEGKVGNVEIGKNWGKTGIRD